MKNPKIKKIHTRIIINAFEQEKRGWLISNTLYKDLRKIKYLDRYYSLSINDGSRNLIKILNYRKSKKELPIKETIQNIDALQKYDSALVRVHYLESEIMKKGEIDIEYIDNNQKKTISVYVIK
jgi:hypothetical protein